MEFCFLVVPGTRNLKPRSVLPLKHTEEGPSLTYPAPGICWHSLACRCITLVPASTVTGVLHPVCLCHLLKTDMILD